MRPMAIEISNVEKRFGTVAAVNSLNLNVVEGEFVSLLGPSGCGKTTTLRMIAGLESPTQGDILVKGKRVNDLPVHKRNFGMVFQNLALFPHKSVFDNIGYGLKYRGVPRAEIAQRVKRALNVVRLPGMEDRMPSQLSGGQQQRVAVARAIVIEPELLLFDEPLSALDAGLREEMRFELKRIQRTLGITTVFVTHDQAEALSMSDKVVVMSGGRIEQEGCPDDIYTRPTTEFVARFFGYVNEFTGRVKEATAGRSTIMLPSGSEITVPVDLAQGSEARLLLRGERLRVVPSDASPQEGHGRVAEADYLGLMVRYVVREGDTEFNILQARNGPLLGEGAQVSVEIPEDAWMVVREGRIVSHA
ncbi:Spermidine/putrescine import ATP-binding protein PotA [Hyphomicrobiales bacterium]|nr:Spermidine/putrescine import ATP-binding protein PotA [Hyphomicrobiales bacterium]CAH1691338.1 Spermidine/putrescine import ATP-binding protein PotA [Hyphomicrobiales bacterium]